jgi:cholesterol transport system auxiliary component
MAAGKVSSRPGLDGLAWQRAATIACLLVLGACGSIIPIGPAPNLYNLTPKSTFSPDLPTIDQQVVVEEPLAAGGLDSNRIALRPSATEIKYFAMSRWTERAPKMVQMLLVESLENSGRIVSVGRQAIGLRSDFNLKTELREFQAEYFDTGGIAPNIRVRINVKIIAQPRQKITASRSFEEVVAATGTDIEAIVHAFDEALGKVQKELVEWVINTIAEQQPRS